MFFVRGLNLCTFTISIAPELLSKTLQCTLAVYVSIGNPFYFDYSNRLIMGMVSRGAYDNPVYSISVEDEAYYVCSRDFFRSGHPAYIMIRPCPDMEVSGSSASFGYQLPVKYASTYTSGSKTLTCLSMVPLFCLPFRYRDNHLKALPCFFLGNLENGHTGNLCRQYHLYSPFTDFSVWK